MFKDLRAHTVVQLKFLVRSRILLGFVLLILFGSGLGLLPGLFFSTAVSRFETLKYVAIGLHWLASSITGGLGLLQLWSHRRTRTLKMVATKPTPFESWVLSIFAASAILGLCAHAIIAVVTVALSLYWHVPYQMGFAYVAIDGFFDSLVILAVLTTLGSICHPVIAFLAMMFFSETTFSYLAISVAGASGAGVNVPAKAIWRPLLTALYYVMPSFGLFDSRTTNVEQSLRVGSSDWRYLAATCGYALLVCSLGYVATIVVLRRRPLV